MQRSRRTRRLLLHKFARRERLPQVAEKGRLLLDVLVTKHGRNGKGGLFTVVEGDAAVEPLAFPLATCGATSGYDKELTGRCGARRGTR
jgi:hypothetical protein